MKRMMMAFLLVLAVGCGDTSSGTDGDGNNDGNTLPQGLCNAANACPSGQFCFNGICALGCTSACSRSGRSGGSLTGAALPPAPA